MDDLGLCENLIMMMHARDEQNINSCDNEMNKFEWGHKGLDLGLA